MYISFMISQISTELFLKDAKLLIFIRKTYSVLCELRIVKLVLNTGTDLYRSVKEYTVRRFSGDHRQPGCAQYFHSLIGNLFSLNMHSTWNPKAAVLPYISSAAHSVTSLFYLRSSIHIHEPFSYLCRTICKKYFCLL